MRKFSGFSVGFHITTYHGLDRLSANRESLEQRLAQFLQLPSEVRAANSREARAIHEDAERFLDELLAYILESRNPPARFLQREIRLVKTVLIAADNVLAPMLASAIGQTAVETHESGRGSGLAAARWARLVPVKDWAFEERRRDPTSSRASVIRRIAPEVRIRAKEVGEPLTGSMESLIATITGWFRDAEIR